MRSGAVTVVIPTYGRDGVLVDTIGSLLGLSSPADRIVVVDQTLRHEPETSTRLAAWAAEGRIVHLRRERPSVPAAMNMGLLTARTEIVLFIDDDIVPGDGLLMAHRAAHADPSVTAVAGRVLQPWHDGRPPKVGNRGRGLRLDLDFPFHSTERTDVANVMAGNLSVKRVAAIAAGGFDESFRGAAYRFETEFCRRVIRSGGRVVFEPDALIHHLKAPSGGIRTWGDHRKTANPEPSVGDYYFALREGRGLAGLAYCARRPLRQAATRFHLARPWWIPVKLLGELRGWLWALRLWSQPPRLLSAKRERSPADGERTTGNK